MDSTNRKTQFMSQYSRNTDQYRQESKLYTEQTPRKSDSYVDRQSLETFISNVQGEVIFPGDPTYEEERDIWNGAIDRHPAIIVRCINPKDVQTAVNFAREQGFEISVRSGGHSVAGYGTNDQGLVIDLSSMKAISVDPTYQIARLEPGLTSGEVATTLQPYGLALTVGDTASVGVGGLLVGGGIGWMVRKYGLTIDRVRAVELVTANGQLLWVSADENPELFWGLRGGGGNFGVVTAFEVNVHPGGTILGGIVFFEAAEAERILQNYVQIALDAPDELSTQAIFITAPPAPFIPTDKQGQPIVGIMVCYTGDLTEGEQVVAPFRRLGTPIADLIAPMPYADIFQFNEIGEVRGLQHHVATSFIETISQEMVHALVSGAQKVMSPGTAIQFRLLGGAMSRVAKDATAFAHRDKQGLIMVTHFGPISADPIDLKSRTYQIDQVLSSYASGAYVNFQPDKGVKGVMEVYPPATYARLAALKRKYDPTNLFHLNQNIIPDTGVFDS